MSLIRIDDDTDSRLDEFRGLRNNRTPRESILIAEGPTVVERLLKSDLRVRSLLISERRIPQFLDRVPADVPVYQVSNAAAESLVGYRFHSGVLASADRRPQPNLELLCPAGQNALVLAADQISDPENVGSLIRSAAAFGASGLLLSSGCADPFSRRALRVSVGNGLFIPVRTTDELSAELRQLRTNHGMSVCAAVLAEDAVPLDRCHFADRTVIVVGNEYNGLTPGVAAECDRRITIPMWRGTDSLNVAVSAAVMAWEYRRGRSST